ncbi:MAG: hypothetical protein ACJ0HU_03410 [Gammaproteobacteria bacterium]
MKKLLLIFILFSSTSLWSNSGIYDCVKSNNQFLTPKIIFKTIKEGSTFTFNSLTLIITKAENKIEGEYRSDDGELQIEIILNQAKGELILIEYNVFDQGKTTKSSYYCNFTPTT